MNTAEILKHVDHTLLKPIATWEDIQKICDESIEYNTASICIPSCYISRINEKYGDKVNICTVVGFPLGYSTTEAKVLEAKQAIENGANEIDMVINISDVKNGDYDKVTAEIKALKEAVGDKMERLLEKKIIPFHHTNRFSPGYCGWKLTEQKTLFTLLGGMPCGIHLSDVCLMTPEKSISGIIGVGHKVNEKAYGCRFCDLKTCYKRKK